MKLGQWVTRFLVISNLTDFIQVEAVRSASVINV